jgi:hypothetical protein
MKQLFTFLFVLMVATKLDAMTPLWSESEKRSLCAQLLVTTSIAYPDATPAQICEILSGPIKLRGQVVVDCSKYCGVKAKP